MKGNVKENLKTAFLSLVVLGVLVLLDVTTAHLMVA